MQEPSTVAAGSTSDDLDVEAMERAVDLASAMALKLIGAEGQQDRLVVAICVPQEYGRPVVRLNIANSFGDGTTPFVVAFRDDAAWQNGPATEEGAQSVARLIGDAPEELLFQAGMDMFHLTNEGDFGFFVWGRGTYESIVQMNVPVNSAGRAPQGVDEGFVSGSLSGAPTANGQ